MPAKGSGDAKKLVLTFEVSVLDKGGDGWEARCDDGDLHLTGIKSQKLLVEKVREHFLRIGDEMGPVGERVLFNLVLDCPDPDAAPTETGAAETEPAGADAAKSGAGAAEPRQDQHPGTKERNRNPKGRPCEPASPKPRTRLKTWSSGSVDSRTRSRTFNPESTTLKRSCRKLDQLGRSALPPVKRGRFRLLPSG